MPEFAQKITEHSQRTPVKDDTSVKNFWFRLKQWFN